MDAPQFDGQERKGPPVRRKKDKKKKKAQLSTNTRPIFAREDSPKKKKEREGAAITLFKLASLQLGTERAVMAKMEQN